MEQTVAANHPLLMVEISGNIPEVLSWLTDRNYLLYDDRRQRL